MPARFDDTEIPGLNKTIKYIDLRNNTPEQFGTLICNKLGRTQLDIQAQAPPPVQLGDEDIPF